MAAKRRSDGWGREQLMLRSQLRLVWVATVTSTVMLAAEAGTGCALASPPAVQPASCQIEQSVVSSVGRMGTLTESEMRDEDAAVEAEMKRLMPDFSIIAKGGSTAADKALGLRQLPLRQLDARERNIVQEITSQCAQFRRLPTITMQCEQAAYQYFVQHPDVAVSLWRALGISEMSVVQQDTERYLSDGGEGTLGQIEYLYRSPQSSLVVCEGSFQSPFLRSPIKARALFHLISEYHPQTNGTMQMRHSANVFVAFPSRPVETAAKLISPISNAIADRNFREVSLFLRTMSTAMEQQPGWVEQISLRLDKVPPETAVEIMEVTVDMHRRYRDRQLELMDAAAVEATPVRMTREVRTATASRAGETATADK